MRFNLFVLVIITVILTGVDGQKLTDQENRERVEKCGKQALPKLTNFVVDAAGQPIDIPKDGSWLVRVHSKKSDSVRTRDSPGTFISPRHVLTSSQPMIQPETEKYGLDGQMLNRSCVGKVYQVPEEYVKNLQITSGECVEAQKCEKRQFEAKKYSAPMLIELNASTNVGFPCLASKNVTNAAILQAYGMKYTNGSFDKGQITYKRAQLIDYVRGEMAWLVVAKQFAEGDRGGPLVHETDGITTLLGIASTSGFDEAYFVDFYFDIRFFEDVIEELVGIRPAPPPTALPKPAPPTPEPLKPDPTTDPPQKGRKEAEKVYDEEDADTDLYVSEDFLDGASGRSKQWIGVALFLIFTF
ncbi:unnamed protein product [Caenorhabditis sp. 36 PRJEB53466]|nr:unnamed protein product [Caenorhabditis sp. 36 PRJEB53466]